MSVKLSVEERYIIAYYRASDSASPVWTWLVVRLSIACFFGYGVYSSDQAFVFTAFGTLLLLDLYFQSKQPRYLRLTRSAVTKLEQRIEELEKTPPIQT